MAKFAIKITLDDGTVVDDVAATFPDAAIAPMQAAATKLGLIDADGNLVTGARAVTYAVRKYLTALVGEYAKEAAALAAAEAAREQVAIMLNSVAIEDNINADPAPQPE